MENFIYHHKKGPDYLPHTLSGRPRTREELKREVDEALKQNPDPYEVVREKPGYTKVTGSALILGDEASSGLRMGIGRNKEGKVDLGAGRIWCSHRKEIAEEGQTAAGFSELIKKRLGFTIKTYANAILQIGKYDLLKGGNAKDTFEEIKKVWKLCDSHKMKVYACTIPPFGGTEEQEAERIALNKLILEDPETDQLVFRVIDLENATQNLQTNDKEVYVEGKHRKALAVTDREKMTVAYLEALMGGGRDSLKAAEQAPEFSAPPTKTAYVALGDSYTKPNESILSGNKKPGHYIETPHVDPVSKQPIEQEPGANTQKMAERLETEVIPQLTKIAGYRCAVIQAGAEDIMRPLHSEKELFRTKNSITNNLKRMYKHCLESVPPVMVVACTMPPMTKYIEEAFPGEENREMRERQIRLWKEVNEFIIKETDRLKHNPRDRYKRIVCVPVHDLVGTRKGYVRDRYRSESGEISSAGRQVIASHIYYLMNWMRIGVEFGKTLFTRPKLDAKGEPVKNEKGEIIFETIWRGPDYLLDEHDYEPGGWKVVKKEDLK